MLVPMAHRQLPALLHEEPSAYIPGFQAVRRAVRDGGLLPRFVRDTTF